MGFSDNPNPDYRDTPNHHLHGALGFTLLGGVQSQSLYRLGVMLDMSH